VAAVAGSAALAAAPADDLMNPVTQLANVAVKVTTNKSGAVSKVLIRTMRSTFEISLKDLAPGALQTLTSLDDKRASMQGELTVTNGVTVVKVIGPIKDVTPTLSGGMLRCVQNQATYKVGSDTFDIATTGVPEGTLKTLMDWGGERPADLDARLSIWDNRIYDLRAIRAKAAPAKKPGTTTKRGR
jgi:hypothetical protein